MINVVAPIRIRAIGGWTDTGFTRRGALFNGAGATERAMIASLAQRGFHEMRTTLSRDGSSGWRTAA